MKNAFLLIIITLLSFSLTAQKAKTRSVGFRYYHLPSDPLNGAVNTYATLVNNTSTQVKLDAGRENSYLKLEGFEKTDLANAGVIIEFSIFGVQSKADIKSKEITKKVDDKDVKITKYYYYISSKTSSEFKLKYSSGQIINSAKFNGGSFLYEYESDLYDSKGEALKAYNEKKKALLKNAADSGLELVLSHIKNYLNENHGYYYKTVYVSISTGKGKKHDYTDLDNAMALYREAAEEYNAKGVSEEFIRKSNQCIDVWKSAISEFDASNKKARISRKNIDKLYANIAFAYLYMNEFEKARQTVKVAMTVGKYESTEKSYIKKINDREARFKLNEKRKQEANNTSVTTNAVVTTNTSSNTSSSTSSSNTTNNSTESTSTTSTITTTSTNAGLKMGIPLAVKLHGINDNYRVKKVTKNYSTSMSEISETTNYYYDGDKLRYTIKDSPKRVDSTSYIYTQGKIIEKVFYYTKSSGKNWLEDKKKTVSYNITNNRVVKKISKSEELIYKYNSAGGLNALIIKNLLYGNKMSKYTFHFNKEKLAQVKVFSFKDGDWVEEKDQVLIFNNKNFTVKQSDYGTVYELDYRNGPLSRIQKYNNFNVEKEEMSYLFIYDANGNISKQKFTNSYDRTENYEIEYENKKGNEKLFLGTKDWRANVLFHQITFNKYFEAAY